MPAQTATGLTQAHSRHQPCEFIDMAVGLANRKDCIKVDANASMTDITF